MFWGDRVLARAPALEKGGNVSGDISNGGRVHFTPATRAPVRVLVYRSFCKYGHFQHLSFQRKFLPCLAVGVSGSRHSYLGSVFLSPYSCPLGARLGLGFLGFLRFSASFLRLRARAPHKEKMWNRSPADGLGLASR